MVSQAPIIRLQSLIRFLDLGQTLTDLSSEDGLTFNQIRGFLGQCIMGNRFCPEGLGRFDPTCNVSFYVTSDGDGDGKVTNQKETMLRVSPSKIQVLKQSPSHGSLPSIAVLIRSVRRPTHARTSPSASSPCLARC